MHAAGGNTKNLTNTGLLGCFSSERDMCERAESSVWKLGREGERVRKGSSWLEIRAKVVQLRAFFHSLSMCHKSKKEWDEKRE